MRTAMLLAVLVCATLAAQDPNDSVRSLRNMLAASGLASLGDHFSAGELDRPLTSSSFDHDGGTFAAALYFVDEMKGEYSLGPAHLLRVDRNGSIQHATLTEDDLLGTARSVDIGPTILIKTHLSPSAGQIAVLAPDLKLIGVLNGFGAQRLPDGAIIYLGSMVHFADVHQASVHVFDPRSATRAELFPVTEGPASLRGHDRSVHALGFNATGSAVAFALGYSDNWYGGDPFVRQTVVRCERSSAKWTCRERTLQDAAREFSITPKAGEFDETTVSAIVDRDLNRK